MNTASEILIIIVSSALTIFLLVLIVALAYAIKVLKSVKRITAKAERVVESAEAVGEVVKSASGKFPLVRLVYNLVEKTVQKKNK